MNRAAVTSSNIAAVGYDPVLQVLEVEFKNGTVYRYDGVSSEIHEAMVTAPSVGGYFSANIRNKFPSTKVEPQEVPA
ncbi:MAG TPA: KTSC domain-containing protein [Gammaproteobacteria bacterium]|jgi:hypothetical protein